MYVVYQSLFTWRVKKINPTQLHGELIFSCNTSSYSLILISLTTNWWSLYLYPYVWVTLFPVAHDTIGLTWIIFILINCTYSLWWFFTIIAVGCGHSLILLYIPFHCQTVCCSGPAIAVTFWNYYPYADSMGWCC